MKLGCCDWVVKTQNQSGNVHEVAGENICRGCLVVFNCRLGYQFVVDWMRINNIE